MFVILLTAQESGRVILGMLIDSRGKVCLCLLTQGKCTNASDSSQLKHREEGLIYTKAGKTVTYDTQGMKLTFQINLLIPF